MPLHLDDRAARLQALEVGVVALLHDIDRQARGLLAGRRSDAAVLRLVFAVGHVAALLLELSAALRAEAEAARRDGA